MIFSKEHKFIFIHIPKTAGSSMNTVLGEGKHGSQQALIRCRESSDGLEKIRISVFNEKKNSLYFENSVDYAHPFYPINRFLVQPYIDDPSYFSFAFVRNPFDRVVSAYTYAKKRKEFEDGEENIDPDFNFSSFTEFCKNYLTKDDLCDPVTKYNVHFLPQYKFLYDPEEADSDNGKPFVSYVGRFENIEEDFNHICKKINIGNITLPKIRNQKRKKHYSEYYDEESKQIVKSVYKKDLELFNYSFETPYIQREQKESLTEFASQYVPTSTQEASTKEGNISYNTGRDTAVITISKERRHSVEAENNILRYAEKHNYTAYIYREKGTTMQDAILNHIDEHKHILFLTDSMLIFNPEIKVEDFFKKNAKYFILSETSEAYLIKSHQYTKNLLKKLTSESSIKEALKTSDPSGFNSKTIKNEGFCLHHEPNNKATPFIWDYSSYTENAKFLQMKMHGESIF